MGTDREHFSSLFLYPRNLRDPWSSMTVQVRMNLSLADQTADYANYAKAGREEL
jgi:hypothetical protein